MQSAARTFALYGCKLTRPTLDALWEAATRDRSSDVRTSASTTVGIVKTEAASVDALVKELGEPVRLTELTMSVYDGRLGDEDSRSTYISIDAEHVYVSVSGQDGTWVRGRADELRDLLRETRSPFGIHSLGAAFAPLILSALLLLGILVAVVSGWRPSDDGLLITFLAVAAVAIVSWLVLKRQSATTLTLATGERTRWTHGDWIGLGILAVALVTLVVIAVQTWGS